jgi:tetratricopeptide (TPR) repeat protein
MENRLASAAFMLVLAAYLFLGAMGLTDRNVPEARDEAYNRLSRGLLAGHLYADKAVPAGLEKLQNPYDPAANVHFRMGPDLAHDFSYYNGRMYLYFGISPALFLFIPWHLVTGSWLLHWAAVVFLCAAGLVLNVSLMCSVKKAVFPSAAPWMLGASVLILGLGSYAPVLLGRADLWEIPIAFSYFGVSVALRCLWIALGRPDAPAGWLALASVAFGAAFAARPTVLPNAAILLLPFFIAETRKSVWSWVAAIVPLGLCGAAVALYNAQRFGNPFEFGQHFQLAGQFVPKAKLFSTDFLWTNLRLYLFQAVEWRPIFPFANDPDLAALPQPHGDVEHISGALLNAPILLASLLALVLFAIRRPQARVTLLVIAASWVSVSSLVLMSLFFGVCARYQFEFLPTIALLAAIGVGAADTLSTGARRVLFRCVWIPALLVSSAFTVLYGIDRCVVDHDALALNDILLGNLKDADHELRIARFLSPGDPMLRLESGVVLVAAGRIAGATQVFEDLVRDFPNDALARYNLGRVLATEGKPGEALVQFKAAHDLAPSDPAILAGLEAAQAKATAPAH